MSHKREMKVSPIRRNYKDTVFRRIFNDKENLLALYNALNQTNYKNSDDIEIITLDNALFLKMKNDIAFLINTTEMCLVEHSSTVCLNYPLRSLLYLSHEYEAILKKRGENILQYHLVKIPTPRCIVLYNGPAARPEREIMKLSDAFASKNAKSSLELTVEIFNINYGKNQALQKGCKTLEDYAILVAKIREYAQKTEDLSLAIHMAVDYCIDHDHLRDFLSLNRVEVEPMLLSEGTVEEYVDSMDQEIERLKADKKGLQQSKKALQQTVLEKDEKLKEKDARIKELEALLASKQS